MRAHGWRLYQTSVLREGSYDGERRGGVAFLMRDCNEWLS